MQRARQRLRQQQPQRPQQQDHAQGKDYRPGDRVGGIGLQAAHDGQELLADQQKHEPLEQEVDQPPDRAGLQPAGAGGEPGRVVPDHQPRHRHGQHAGHVGLFAEQVGGEGRGQRDAVDQQRVADGGPQPAHHQRDGDPGQQAAGRLGQEAQHRVAQ